LSSIGLPVGPSWPNWRMGTMELISKEEYYDEAIVQVFNPSYMSIYSFIHFPQLL